MTHIRFVDDLSETTNVARRMFTPIVAQQELENAPAEGLKLRKGDT